MKSTTVSADREKVLELDPGNAKAYIYIGQLLLRQGKTGEATKYLQQGRELDPESSRTEIDVGMELSYREQFNAAAQGQPSRDRRSREGCFSARPDRLLH